MGWLSVHLFLDPAMDSTTYLGDLALLELVRPWLRKWRRESRIRRFFFIRYGDLGPHIRLRIQGESKFLEQTIRPSIVHTARLDQRASRDQSGIYYSAAHDLVDHVRFLDYQPELARYGGEKAILVAESLFQASSELCLELVATDAAGDPALRKALALLAISVQLTALCDDLALELSHAEAYRDFAWRIHQSLCEARGIERPAEGAWRELFDDGYIRQSSSLSEQVIDLRQLLAGGEQAPEPFLTYHLTLMQLRKNLASLWQQGELVLGVDRLRASWRQSLRQLIPSYLHMTSNRLGISVIEEAYLAQLAGRILSASYAGQPA
ncbi:MAG: thiopeptide-type bacteriocin biosynthesis protein [Holophagales bacterium]|nr:thiopeptide-type bacteriocin biosynthesis protein [Holophagales bacterium]